MRDPKFLITVSASFMASSSGPVTTATICRGVQPIHLDSLDAIYEMFTVAMLSAAHSGAGHASVTQHLSRTPLPTFQCTSASGARLLQTRLLVRYKCQNAGLSRCELLSDYTT